MLQFLIDTLLRTADLALVALGLSMVYGLARFPNIAHVQYAMQGAYCTYALQAAGAPFFAALLMACLLTGGLAVLLNLFVFERLLRAGPAFAMIGSLAVSMLLIAVVLAAAGSAPRNYSLALSSPIIVGNARISPVQLSALCGSAAILIAFAVLLFRTRVGRAMRAIATNRALAGAAGLNVAAYAHLANFLSGLLAAFGGAMLATNTGAHVNLGNDLLLPVFAVAVLGGLGNPIGAVFGALLIAVTETAVTNINIGWLTGVKIAFFPVTYIGAASFAILICALLFRPHGLFDREIRRV